ncbi:PIN domain-containing protein [Acanthopleuribacter pedis]|uniref:PIN domain-containing protein n=1 Tax=Acanthopleuribacter pedis TaxID=442870 RepID=A0A8J7Q9E2_9BACT|nr:PIN domain-containing protein [Acanthopleuribacter pedis]MBO1320142.1 PIN domain-containing protein [Acanthopleuribacter pedis]
MVGRYFIDTGIFLASFDESNPGRCEIARKLIGTALAEHVGIISYQIVEEVLTLVLDRFEVKLSQPDAESYLERVLLPLCEVYPTSELYQSALSLADERKLSCRDALVVAAARWGSCRVLFSEKFRSGGQIGALALHDPFTA